MLAHFASKLVNYSRHSEYLNIRKNSEIVDIFLPRKLIVDFQTYFVVHEQSAVENSFSTYVCYAPDGLFWLNLYTSFYYCYVELFMVDVSWDAMATCLKLVELS